ncbi:FadR/GntR family transcriptional regulator [Dictyobacter formicarum]|uniref:GntR family transcriptional regulator n=1 Tax=Dictyobacter formicarum TaxID=2778368 RepID=A0ABQ3VIT5_9CHLR|nr:FadR/GntR family transcriptional regulator [Dictyobacter formicarum]GHO86114.1 GntR family transcriptional regulator [Dictyobacter formicarum]
MTATTRVESSYHPQYESIATKLVEFIQQTKLQPGDRLPTEQQLAEQLGVSRAVVREAVKMLTASGYVRTRRGSGIYVNDKTRPFAAAAIEFSMPVDPEHVRELFEFRSLQETLTARLATERITLSELRTLEKSVHLNRQAAEAGDWDLFLETDNAFHYGIAEAAHNPFLLETVATVMRLQRWAIKMATGGAPGSLLASADQHDAIFASLKNGAPEVTVQAMKEHIESVFQAYQQDVRRRLMENKQA